LAIAKCGHKWQYLDNETQTGDRQMTMTIRKNAKATAAYVAAETAAIMADFALDMLASAHRTGMDTFSIAYESLRFNTIARIEDAAGAFDVINKPEMYDAYIARYNEIIAA
jgi:hypothetical protein